MAGNVKYELGDLVPEMLDLVLSFLPDIDLINVRKVNSQFDDSFHRIMSYKRRKLDFSKCFYLQEEELTHVLGLAKDNITCVNINHCYWLRSGVLSLIMKLPKLQELHMVDCKVSAYIIKKSLPVGLTALSFSWDSVWLKHLFNDQILCGKYTHRLFEKMKCLSIYFPVTQKKNIFADISINVLRHCSQLETLELYDSPYCAPASAKDYDWPTEFLPYAGLLPKLFKFHFDLSVPKNNIPSLYNWMKAILLGRTTLLREVYFGKASFSLLEDCASWTLPYISTDEISAVCLDNSCSPRDVDILPAIPMIWKERKTPNCQSVALRGLKLTNINMNTVCVSHAGSHLERLSFRDCIISISELMMGLTIIIGHCTRLISLDLTIQSSSCRAL